MSDKQEREKLRRRRIIGSVVYLLTGFVILAVLLGPAILGYRGPYAADMATEAFVVLAIVWIGAFPVFLSVGLLIDTVVVLFRGDQDLKLR